jgi:hypothetical protein
MAGSLEAGWRPATKVPTYYRIQRPASLAGSSIKDERGSRLGTSVRSLSGLATPVARAYLRVRDRLRSVPEGISIERHRDLPAETFASLYERSRPEYVHALRDREFYEWRFSNPNWRYVAYTARREGTPIAGIVTARGTDGEATVTNVVDAVPMVTDSTEERALAATLDRIVRDHAAADVLALRGKTISRSVLARHGFHADRSFPLSYVSSPSTLVTRPTAIEGEGDGSDEEESAPSWTVAGVDLLDESNWALTLSELDTA